MNKTYLAVVLCLTLIIIAYGTLVHSAPFLSVCAGVALVVGAITLKPPPSSSL